MSDNIQQAKLPNGQAVSKHVAVILADVLDQSLKPGLYVVATPIGNLGDITLRALGVLVNADVVYCEDTRHSRKLLARFGIDTKLKVYEEHTAKSERPRILKALGKGQSVALISDAGTPLISDPGYKLVHETIAAGHDVFAVPGASAITASLSIAGLPTDKFYFQGFLPTKATARRNRLQELRGQAATLVLYEAPNRLTAMLADAANVMGDRQAAVARELTKLHEEVVRGSLSELADWAKATPARGEVAIIVGPPGRIEPTDEAITDALAAALETSSMRDATRQIAEIFGTSRKRVYELGLALRDSGRAK